MKDLQGVSCNLYFSTWSVDIWQHPYFKESFQFLISHLLQTPTSTGTGMGGWSHGPYGHVAMSPCHAMPCHVNMSPCWKHVAWYGLGGGIACLLSLPFLSSQPECLHKGLSRFWGDRILERGAVSVYPTLLNHYTRLHYLKKTIILWKIYKMGIPLKFILDCFLNKGLMWILMMTSCNKNKNMAQVPIKIHIEIRRFWHEL